MSVSRLNSINTVQHISICVYKKKKKNVQIIIIIIIIDKCKFPVSRVNYFRNLLQRNKQKAVKDQFKTIVMSEV